MDNLISLLTGLSDSQVRAFRHTSTLAGKHSFLLYKYFPGDWLGLFSVFQSWIFFPNCTLGLYFKAMVLLSQTQFHFSLVEL